MTTAEINAYLDWRAQREGRQVDVSPEAYHRDCIIQKIIKTIDTWQYGPQPMDQEHPTLTALGLFCQELDELEKEN